MKKIDIKSFFKDKKIDAAAIFKNGKLKIKKALKELKVLKGQEALKEQQIPEEQQALKEQKDSNVKKDKLVKGKLGAMGIAPKLICEIVLLIVLVCAVLTIVSYNKSSQIITSNIMNDLENRAQENASTLNEKIMQWSTQMQTLARREGIVSMDWEVQETIVYGEARLLGYEKLQVSNSKGITNYPGQKNTVDLKDEENIQLALKGKTYITPPKVSDIDGKLIMVVTTPIYNKGANRIIGVLGGDINAEQFNQIVQDIDLGENGYAYILDANGTRIADKDINVVIEGRADVIEYEGVAGYEDYVETQKAMIAGEQGIAEYTYEGVEYYAAYHPLSVQGWSLALAMPKEEVMQEVTALRNFMLAIAAVFVLIGIVISVVIARTIKKPLVKINKFAQELSNGNMSYKIQENRKDEFGQTCMALNVAQKNMSEVIKGITDNAQGLSSAGEELSATTEEIQARLEMIDRASNQVVSGCEDNKECVQDVKAYIENMQENMDILNGKAQLQNQKAEEFKNRALNVQQTAKDAIKNSRIMCQKQSEKLVEAIEAGKVVEEVKVMADAIGDISEQINLLSLNASIEAARAGESGRGFAVVANEVGKLAMQTKSTVNTIQETIQKVRDAFGVLSNNGKELLAFVDEEVQPQFDAYLNTGENYYQDSEYVYKLSEEQVQMVNRLAEAIANVNNAMERVEQTSVTSLDNTLQIQEQINHTTEGMQEVVKATENIANSAEELNDSAQQFSV